ncbi:hypothetical protein IT570_04990 [Candidatus Sumerlaeota bacterium]|nr:hypothetical protein [Candidatus Sumerlaeota bacterium]
MSELIQLLTSQKIAASFFDPPVRVSGAGEQLIVTAGPDEKRVIYVALRHGGKTVRVGFAAKDRWTNEEIEEAVESNGGTMTEFLEDEMEADDELEFPVQHFHDTGWFHFACDIPKSPEFFNTREGRDLVAYYFGGYCKAILPILNREKD